MQKNIHATISYYCELQRYDFVKDSLLHWLLLLRRSSLCLCDLPYTSLFIRSFVCCYGEEVYNIQYIYIDRIHIFKANWHLSVIII